MRSFLGIPIFVRDEVYGNLYLTDKRGGAEFSVADVELAEALGREPTMHFEGPIDTAVPSAVGAHVAAVVREGLSNVIRRAAFALTTGGAGSFEGGGLRKLPPPTSPCSETPTAGTTSVRVV